MKQFHKLKSELSKDGRVLDVADFKLHYRERNPSNGTCSGSEGVSDKRLVDAFAESLAKLHSRLCDPQHGLQLQAHSINIYITDAFGFNPFSPHKTTDREGLPYAVLPCRIHEASPEFERFYATACAIHEGSHVFTHAYLPGLDSWQWFDEATAVWLELLLSPGNPFTLEYFMMWCDHPEESLENDPEWYGSGLFAAYLANRFGEDFISKIWKVKDKPPTPLAVICDFSKCEAVFHEYAVASYFATTPQGDPTVFRAALRRFGGRALAESFNEVPKHPVEIVLPKPLSVSYFRFALPSNVQSLSISANTQLPKGIRVGLAASSSDLQRIDNGVEGGESTIQVPTFTES